jgi:hypothetical protein
MTKCDLFIHKRKTSLGTRCSTLPGSLRCWCYERIMWRPPAGHGKIGVQEFAAQCAASKRWLTVEAPMPSKPDPAEMPRLDAFDEEFGQDPATILRAERRGLRLLSLVAVALGAGVIGAFALAWSTADGRLRLELQSAATAPRKADRAGQDEEIDRLRGQLDALKNDVKELTEAQHQAAHTIAAMKAAEEDLRRDVPPPSWYSNPATLDLAIGNQPQWAGVAPPPRRPATARSESRGLRKREGAAPASPASPR